MKKESFLIVACLLFFGVTYSQEIDNHSKNELIVKFKTDADYSLHQILTDKKFGNPDLDLLNNQKSVTKIESIGNKKTRGTYLFEFADEQDIVELIDIYLSTNLFEYVEPNYIGSGGEKPNAVQIIPDDAYFSRQYGLYNDGTFSYSPTVTEDADIDMELGWDIEQGDNSIVVAVLDAGVKLDHPEFEGRVWANDNESINDSDDDSNGYIDDVQGWDFANNDNIPADDHGHGTNVAGIIGANANNNIGYAGVDWNCKLMICKILDSENSGFYSWWANAIYYAVDNGANVINMSVGGASYSSLMEDAVNYAYNNNVMIVACMMNYNNSVTYYPAGYQNTVAVGSTDPDDQRSSPFPWSPTSGSNFGNHIDIVAPGNYIFGLDYLSDTNYNYFWSGTSQATPLVTGVGALLLSQDNTRTPDDLRNIIRVTAEDEVGDDVEDTPGFDIYYGYGRLNAHQALQQAVSVNELSLEDSDLVIFPNPTTNYLYVSSVKKNQNLIVTNFVGKIIYHQKISTESDLLKIDAASFAKGIYIVQLIDSENNRILSKKLIVY